MSSPSDLYVEGIHKRFSYLANWLPNTALALGDVGVQEGRYFKRLTSLKDLAIGFEIREGKHPIDFSHTSQSGVSVSIKAEGEVIPGTSIPTGQAGAVIEFGKEGAFLFQAIRCLVDEIENKQGLGRSIINKFEEKKWEPSWVVVDTVVKAGGSTILVSNSQSAKLELKSSIPLEATNLAKVDAGISVHHQSGSVTRFLAVEGITPLFKLSRLKRSFFSRIAGKPIRFGGKLSEAIPAGGQLLEAVELNDLNQNESDDV